MEDASQDKWERIGIIAQRMAMAWDRNEERDEARALVTYSTDRQRSVIACELWIQASKKWRDWFVGWVESPAAMKAIEQHAKAAEAGRNENV